MAALALERATGWSPGLVERDAVVVDVETTGLSPAHDRIIEIAAVRVRAGRIVGRWHSLVNPEIPVPPFITGLTGITTGMTASAPRFAEIWPRWQEFAGDAILFAHNATFDAGFLRREQVRSGQPPLPLDFLCTRQLARRLAPRLPSYRLEALAQHFGLPARRYHRALPDALATAELLDHLVQSASAEGIDDWDAVRALLAARPRARSRGGYDRARLKELPTGPGVYLLKDTEQNVFYVGKSVNLRRRVGDHLRGHSDGQPRLRRQLKGLADVDTISTETELEALLLEARLIKQYLPVANQQLRDDVHYPYIKIDVQSAFPRIELTRVPESDGAVYVGPFRSARLVGHVVEYVRAAFGLRECRRPRLPDGRACLLQDMGKCLAPCVGAVDAAGYRSAVERAITVLQGEWMEIASGLEERMRTLAEQEQFEEAAELRDVLVQLRSLEGPRRLAETAQRHLVIVARLGPGRYRLLFVRAGRLVEQVTVGWPAEAASLGGLCRRVFGRPATVGAARESCDELWLLGSWVRQADQHPDHTVIDVDPADPARALAAIRAELTREDPVPSTGEGSR